MPLAGALDAPPTDSPHGDLIVAHYETITPTQPGKPAPGPAGHRAAIRAGDAQFYGWRVVAAAFVVAVFGWGTGFYGPPAYLEMVHQSRGWSIALVSGAVTLHFLVGLALIPTLPALHRRFGLPIMTFAAGVVMALGVVGWACAAVPWQLYAAAVLTGIGWSALGAATVNAIVAPWFNARRPLALGVAFNGGSVGGVIFSPLWIALIHSVGFLTAAVVVGVVMVGTLGALAVLVLGRSPESLGQSPDGATSAGGNPASAAIAETGIPARFVPFRDRAFLTLCIGMTLALFAQTGLVAHLISVLTPALGAQGAGLAAGACGVAAVAGRLVVGWRASGRSNWRAIASLSLLSQALGCGIFILAGGADVALLILGVVLFGFGVGNAISVPPVIANIEFSSRDAARAVALIVAISQGAYAMAPAVFGLLRQTWSDHSIFLISAAIQLLAVVAYLSAPDSANSRSTK
jgi:MFS family permease